MLIRQLPNDTYTEKQIHKIIEYIKNGDITSVDEFPEPTKNGVKVSLEIIEDKKETPTKIIEPPKPIKVVGRRKKTEKPKVVEKKPKREKKLKPYYKVGDVPEGYRRASMEEAIQAKKVFYFGEKKIDSKLIHKIEGKPVVNDKSQLQIKMAGLVGSLSRLKRITENPTTEEEKKNIKQNLEEFHKKRDELIKLNELYKKNTAYVRM